MRPIDADALKEWVEEYHASNWGIPQDELIYAIGSAPTIDTVKRGKWVRRIGNGNIALIECSECNFEYPILLAHRFRYCPNCGAKMEGVEDERTD